MLPLYRTPIHVYNYEDIPPGYYYEVMQSGGAVQRYWHRKKFAAVASRIRDGEKVLDLGCGPGSFLSILGEMNSKVEGIGLDIAKPQVEFANREVGLKYPGRIRFQQHDFATPVLPFPDRSFDVVTSIEVIEHIHPYVAYRTLEDVKRILKPGGRLIVTTPNYRSLWPLIEIALQRLSPVKYHEQHINKFTPNSLVKFLESIEFEVTDFSTLFVLAPFLAGVSWKLAEFVQGLEKASRMRVGSLLIAEAVHRPLALHQAPPSPAP